MHTGKTIPWKIFPTWMVFFGCRPKIQKITRRGVINLGSLLEQKTNSRLLHIVLKVPSPKQDVPSVKMRSQLVCDDQLTEFHTF